MATKQTPISTKLNTKLEAIGIKVKTEEAARERLLGILAKENVEGVDDLALTELIEMATVFVGEGTDDDEEEEVAAPVAKKGSKKVVVEEEDDEDEEEEMDQLVEEVKSKKLTNKKPEVVAPAKKATEAKVAKAKVKTPVERKKLEGARWEDLTDEQRKKAIKPLVKLMPADKFKFDFLQKGFTVKFFGKSTEQNILKVALARVLDNGKLEGVFVSFRFKKLEELAEFLPEEVNDAIEAGERKIKLGDSTTYIHPYGLDEMIWTLTETDFLEKSIALAEKMDSKMSTNRKKLEEGMSSTTATKKVVKKAPVVEEEEDDEEEVAPVKKATKKAPVEEEDEDEEEEVVVVKKATKKVEPAAPAKKAAKKVVVVEEEDDEEEEEVVPVKKAATKKK